MSRSRIIVYDEVSFIAINFGLGSYWHEMIPWIRSWGSQVRVIEPLELRDEIVADTYKVTAMYD